MSKRMIRVDGCVAYVPLTKGYEAVVDASDVDLLKNYNWQALVGPSGIVYAKRSIRMPGKGVVTVFMHREIVSAKAGEEVDHRDHDGLNNRKGNLRRCTTSENQRNTTKNKRNTSGYKGVTWDKSKNKWKASMQLNGKGKHIGHFKTPEEASTAYREVCMKLHGEFYCEPRATT